MDFKVIDYCVCSSCGAQFDEPMYVMKPVSPYDEVEIDVCPFCECDELNYIAE